MEYLKKRNIFGFIFLSALVTILLFFSVINEYPYKNDYNFSLYFTAEHNEASQYNEIWLKNVVVDGDLQLASSYGIPQGWEDYAGFLHVFGEAEGKQPLHISMFNVGQVQLDFALTNTSGIIHIVGADGEQKFDLYSKQSIDLAPQNIYVGITPHVPSVIKMIGFCTLAMFLSFSCLVIIQRYSKCFVLWQALISSALLFISKKMHFELADTLLILFFSLLSGVIFPYARNTDDMERFHTRSFAIRISIISLYAAFALVGQPLILKPTTVDFSTETISYLLLLTILIAPILYSALFLLARMKRILTVDRRVTPFNISGKWWKLFGIMILMYSLCLLIEWPGNIPSDAINIWDIAHGRASYRSGHPYYYYQLIVLCSRIIDHPAFAIVLQYTFFSAVCSSILIYLCRNNLSWRFSIVFSMVFPLLWSNGIGQTTLVKDYPTATSLLLLTFLFVKFIEERESFFHPKYLFLLGITFLLVALLRPNTSIVLYLSLSLFTVLSYIWIPRKRIVASLFCIIVITVYFLSSTPVKIQYGDTTERNSSQNHFLFMVADHLSGIKASGERLSPETESWMESFMTNEEWVNEYHAYNMDPYPSEKYNKFIEANTLSTVLPVLLESFKAAPLITIKTRLNKLNILWDMTPIKGNQNYMHLFIQQQPNEWNSTINDSVTKRALLTVLSSNSLLSNIMMRVSFNSGFYIVLLLLLWLYWSKSPLQKLRWAMAPIAVNVITLIISCSWQDFRFYYAVLPITIFMLLISVCAESKGLQLEMLNN